MVERKWAVQIGTIIAAERGSVRKVLPQGPRGIFLSEFLVHHYFLCKNVGKGTINKSSSFYYLGLTTPPPPQ